MHTPCPSLNSDRGQRLDLQFMLLARGTVSRFHGFLVRNQPYLTLVAFEGGSLRRELFDAVRCGALFVSNLHQRIFLPGHNLRRARSASHLSIFGSHARRLFEEIASLHAQHNALLDPASGFQVQAAVICMIGSCLTAKFLYSSNEPLASRDRQNCLPPSLSLSSSLPLSR